MSINNPLPSPAQSLAHNLDALHQAGHSYLDIPAQIALASSDQSQNTILSIADKIKSVVANNKTAIESFFNDPQQSRLPSATQQLTSFLHGSVGTSITTENHVLKIQQDMVKAGKAPGLVANGVWDTTWTNAAANAQTDALNKPTTGNAPAKSTVQHILNALGETTNVNFLINVVKALPREVLHLMGDTVVNTANNLTFKNPSGSETNPTVAKIGQAIAQAGSKVENRTTTKEFTKTAASPAQIFQDTMTLLTFLPMARLATGFKEAGTIAKGGVLTAAEVQPKYTLLNSIVSSSQKGEVGLLQPSARALSNKPILNTIYKIGATGIAKSAPTQIAIRDTLAQRLRLPLVRAANKAGLAVLGAGLKEQGIALAESKTGGREGALDSTVYGLAPISGILANAIDIFSMQMNPGNIAGTRQIVGDTAKAAEQLRQAFDDTGVLRAWQKANPQIDYPALVADHIASGGNESDVLMTIGHQVNQIAVDHAVQELKNSLIIDGSWATMNATEKEQWATVYSNMIWKDSTGPSSALSLARESLVIDQNALETGFREIGSRAMQDTKDVRIARKGTSHFADQIKANRVMNWLLQPEQAQYWIHPGTIGEFQAQVKSQQELSALAESDLAAGIGSGEVPMPSKPKLNRAFVEMSNPSMPDGAAGLATIDKLTSADAKKIYNKLAEQVNNATTPELKATVRTDIANTLIHEFGINVFKLGDYNTEDLLGILESESKKLAGNLHVVRDAPQEVKDALNQLTALGYKPVYGTDIGHIFTKSAQYTDLGASGFSKEAKVARALGVSPRLSDSAAVSARTRVETDREIQARIDSGKIDVLPGFNASRVLAYLRDGLPKEAELTFGQNFVLEASRRGIPLLFSKKYEIPINRLMELNKSDPNFTREQAWAQIKQSKIGEMGLREVDPKTIIKILTNPIPKDVASMMGIDQGTQFMSKESAQQFVQALWKARVNVPWEMIGGLAKIEDMLYAGLGVGKVKWLGKSAMTVAAVPAKLMNLRSRVRYQESIVFAYRRMFKTMAKGITENIPPVMYPQSKMDEMGITDAATAIHARIFPQDAIKTSFMDDAERMVNQADFYNLYSPIDSEKWATYWLSKQGFSDAEIAKKVENIMGYGERTAAERSLNAVFFPFSFNKTVMRQFGGFLLSHPGQALVINGIIDLYDQINGPEYLKWFEDNAPLIKQVEAMNALQHGVGLGQLGGINAPYVSGLSGLFTILGPKTINYGTTAQNDVWMTTMKKYIPMVKEFSDLFMGVQTPGHMFEGQIQNTIKTALGVADNVKERITGTYVPETVWHPSRHNMMPIAAQQSAAWDYRSQLITGLTKVLDYNYKNPNNRAVWPDWVPIETGLQGHPITKASIGELVHYKYPAWDNAASAVIAQRKATEADRFIGEVTAKNPTLGATYRQFEDYAKRVSDAVSRDSIAIPKLAQITDIFRGIAIDLSAKDSNFAGFYKTHYQRLFGPLEAFKP